MKSWRFSLPYALFGAGRMGIGATATIYMLSQGASFSDIALIKIIQAIVIFFAEIPTGLIADHFGRKVSSICAIGCAILSFCVFVVGDSFTAFATAEALNALTICFWSGAFTALVVDSTKEKARVEGYLESLFSKMNIWSSIGIMISGFIGGLLHDIDIRFPFLFSSFIMILAYVALKVLIKEDRKSSENNLVEEKTKKFFKKQSAQIAEIVRVVRSDYRFVHFFIIQILIQFAFQPLLHYWQPYLQELSPDQSGRVLGSTFFLYVGADLAFNIFSKTLVDRNPRIVRTLIVLEIGSMIFALSLMAAASSLIVGLGAFLVAQGAGKNMRNLLEAGLNRRIGTESRATFLSCISFVSRIGMFASLAIVSLIVDQLSGVSQLFILSVISTIGLIPFFILWNQEKAEYSSFEVEARWKI